MNTPPRAPQEAAVPNAAARPAEASPRWALPVTALTMLLSLGLAACQPQPGTADNASIGQRLDAAVQGAEQRAQQAREEVASAASQARDQAAATADAAGTALKDATITAAVNARLATDPDLSALRINVDTREGRVALSGDAPSMTARNRAAELARSVDGVVDVENRLTIQSQG